MTVWEQETSQRGSGVRVTTEASCTRAREARDAFGLGRLAFELSLQEEVVAHHSPFAAAPPPNGEQLPMHVSNYLYE